MRQTVMTQISSCTGADEYCNSMDDDCDGTVDEDDAVDVETFYFDADKDGLAQRL